MPASTLRVILIDVRVKWPSERSEWLCTFAQLYLLSFSGTRLDDKKLAEWHPKHGPITKIMLPNGVKGDTAPLALGLWYDFHEVGDHLGNVR